MLLQKLNWRQELVLLGLVSMETIWLAALFLTLLQPPAGTQPLITAAVVAVLILLPTYLTRMLGHWEAPPRLHWVIMTVTLLLVTVLLFKCYILPPLETEGTTLFTLTNALTILLILAAWWRGSTLAQLDVSTPNVAIVHFWLGLSVFLLCIILGEALLGQLSAIESESESPAATAQVIGFIPAYFLLSLVTLSVARIEEVTQLPESTASAPRPRFWLIFIAGVSALVAVAGLLLSLFFTGGGLARSLGWVPPVLEMLGRILQFLGEILVAILGVLFSLLAPILQWVANWIPFESLSQAFQTLAENLQELQKAAQQMEQNPAARSVWAILIQIALVAAVILAVIWLGRAVLWRRQRAKKLVDDQQARTSALVRDPKDEGLLQRGLDRLSDRFREGLRFFRAQTIRRIYANLLRLTSQKGYPRWPQQTPAEYLEFLCEAWPDHHPDVQIITEAYIHAHYGQVPDTQEELARIREAWQRIRASA